VEVLERAPHNILSPQGLKQAAADGFRSLQVCKISTFIFIWLYLYIVVISVSVEWCIGKPLSSYLLLSHLMIALASHIAIILTCTLPFNLSPALPLVDSHALQDKYYDIRGESKLSGSGLDSQSQETNSNSNSTNKDLRAGDMFRLRSLKFPQYVMWICEFRYGLWCMFRAVTIALYCCCHTITTSALEIPDLLLSRSVIALALHLTIILMITRTSIKFQPLNQP